MTDFGSMVLTIRSITVVEQLADWIEVFQYLVAYSTGPMLWDSETSSKTGFTNYFLVIFQNEGSNGRAQFDPKFR